MTGRILIVFVFIFAFSVHAQETSSGKQKNTPPSNSPQQTDELLKHLAAAEASQRNGNLESAGIENRAVLGIALQRFGKIAIEEGKYTEAVKALAKSLEYSDTAANRTNLAIAFMRQNLFEKALTEAKTAVNIDSSHIGAHYILGNIYYAKEDYAAALPELEMVFSAAPDFEIGRALGFTYLSLKKPEKARSHFATLRSMVKKDTAGLHILFAKFYERTNYPADAERELMIALELEPNRPKTNTYLGYLLMQNAGSERLDEAGAAFERELKIKGDDFYALFFAGVAASSRKDHEKAVPLLTKAIAVNPDSGEAHLFLAQSQIDLGKLVDAEMNLRRAVELEKNGGKNTQARRTHFLLGRLLIRLGKKEEGRKELKIAGELQKAALSSSRNEINRILGQVAGETELDSTVETATSNIEIKLAPERVAQLEKLKLFLTDVIAQGFNNLGVIATQGNQLNAAAENFSNALLWDPNFPNANRNLGIVSFRAGEFEKAIVPLTIQLKANPQDILIRKMLGVSFYFRKDYSKSVETLSPLGQSIVNDAELTYFYGISLIKLEKNKEAVPVFTRLAEVSRQSPVALLYAAQGFMTLGDFERAVVEFKRVISLKPDTPKANYFIGQSLIRLNRLADAEQAFSRELEISPSDAISRYHLALTLIERRIDRERAVKLLKEAIGLRYKYADAHYQLGKIYLEEGKTQEAIEELERAVLADKSKDYIHYQLSIAYRKVSRKADADRELKIYKELKEGKRKTDTPMPMGGNKNSPAL